MSGPVLPTEDQYRMTITNGGHGHVFPRPDGVKARCGGPGICAECSRDLALRKSQEAVDPLVAEAKAALGCWMSGTWRNPYAATQFARLLEQFIKRASP